MANYNKRSSLFDTLGLRSLLGLGEEYSNEDSPKISGAADEFLEWLEIQLKNFGDTDVEIRDGGIIRSKPSIEVEDVKDLANHFRDALEKRFIGKKIPVSEAKRAVKDDD